MSRNNPTDMSTLEPDAGAPADSASSGARGGKSIRLDSKAEGDAPVFRLDALAPGAAQDGSSPLQAPTGPRVSHAAIFFLLLIVVGGGLLFAMRTIGINPMSAIAKMKEPEIDLTKNMKSSLDHNRVLRDLSESAIKSQVPIEQVQKNPFEIPEVVPAQTSDDPAVAARQAAERARKDAETRRQRLKSSLASLKLHSVLGGSTPVARINDKAVRVGDTIDDFFTVKAIRGRTVELECDGETYTLSLDDDSSAPQKSAPRKR